MINAAVAYVTAVITAVALAVSGVAVASQGNDSSEAREEPSPTTQRPTTTSTTLAPVPVVIPALGGMTAGEARRALRAEGLDMTSSEVDAAVGSAVDVVVASEPPEGASVLPGDTVNVIVGRRPEAPFVDRDPPILWDEVDAIDTVEDTVGRCSVGRLDGSLLTLDFADCGGPHDFQYLARIDLIESFSTREEAGSALWDACIKAFEGFVGVPWAGSALNLERALGWESGVAGGSGECLITALSRDQQIVGDAAGSLW